MPEIRKAFPADLVAARLVQKSSMADGAEYSSSDDDDGYGAGKKIDKRIPIYVPLWWLVLKHLLMVGKPEGGKTPWLLTFLLWATNEFALRQYYSEVIIICGHARVQATTTWEQMRTIGACSDGCTTSRILMVLTSLTTGSGTSTL